MSTWDSLSQRDRDACVGAGRFNAHGRARVEPCTVCPFCGDIVTVEVHKDCSEHREINEDWRREQYDTTEETR